MHLTPSEPDASYARAVYGGFHDPRSSSTQCLLPEEQPAHHHDPRRTLLLVFVHGFMGDETSFQSFPAHLHNVVTLTLGETHAVHTKIYPRYRSRRRLEFAAEEFSKWLQPHLGPDTDVILLGHSMGGLLTADVVLLPGARPQPFRHRILGTISFDTPFLGMHPGVIKSSLSGIFRPAPEKSPGLQPESSLASQSSQATSTDTLQSFQTGEGSGVSSPPPRINTLFSINLSDPNYNPSFQNDVVLPVRKGWSNAWHFVNKHSDGLVTASKQLVKSHLEFGGAMADYSELKRRYKRIRALEEEDETRRQAAIQGCASAPVPRVRFINFYTASTGRPKAANRSGDASPNRSIDHSTDVSADMSLLSLTTGYQDTSSLRSSLAPSLKSPPAGKDMAREPVEYLTPAHSRSESASPRCSGDMQQMYPGDGVRGREEVPAAEQTQKTGEELRMEQERQRVKAEAQRMKEAEAERLRVQRRMLGLPPNDVDETQPQPGREEADGIQDEEEENEAKEKENVVESVEQQHLAGNAASPVDHPRFASPSRCPSPVPSSSHNTYRTHASPAYQTASASNHPPSSPQPSSSSAKLKPPKPAKDRKFCMLPSNHASDHTWIRVFMRDVDEVGAHCGLFSVGETYAMLVGEVAATVERWVNEDVGERWARNAAEVGQVL